MEFKDYRRYKWFYTSSGKLVVGGKSAEQNDELLEKIKNIKEDLIVMHTSSPGSPFSVVISDIKKISKNDLEESAIFTGCFSKAWKSGKNKITVDIFKKSQLNKSKNMKTGTWGVSGKVEKINAELELVLIRQDGVLRAVPKKRIEKEKVIAQIKQGKLTKEEFFTVISKELKGELNKEEFLSALPAGGFKK